MAEYENEMEADCQVGIGSSQRNRMVEGSSPTMRLALVSTPSRWAQIMARLTPRSSQSRRR